MGVRIEMKCDGCDAAQTTAGAYRTFEGFSGRSHGFGVFRVPTIESLVEPTGWIWPDPYTGCTYCPKCWAEIDGSKE